MNIQEFYDKQKEAAILLYQGQEAGLAVLQELLAGIYELLQALVEEIPESVSILQQLLPVFEEAWTNRDKLCLADILYHNMGDLIVQYAEVHQITLHMQQETVVYNDTIAVDMKKNYEKNKALLLCKEPKDVQMPEELIHCCEQFCLDKEGIAGDTYGNIMILQQNHWWCLNSTYSRKTAVQYALQPLHNQVRKKFIYVVGMANMDYVHQILAESSSDTVVIVYEPNPDIFALNMYISDMEDICKRENAFLFVRGINDAILYDVVRSLVNEKNQSFMYTFVSPGYETLYKQETVEFAQKCNQAIKTAVLTDITIRKKRTALNHNRIMNLCFLHESILVSELREHMQNSSNIENVPAIVVAAGPSLDTNIQYLQQAKGKAFIIAVDSALRMLATNDIMPDAIVSVDPDKQRILFENEVAKNVPLFYCLHSTWDAIKELQGQKVLCVTDAFMPYELKEESNDVISGGSVANMAIAICQALGFQTVIAIGLDLAFTNNKIHASVSYADGGVNMASKDYAYTLGQNGKQILTYQTFIEYKKEIERRLEQAEHFTLVNATGAGALIKGAVYMTFEEAIRTYCEKNINCAYFFALQTPSKLQDICVNETDYIEKIIQECEQAKKITAACKQTYQTMYACKDTKKLQAGMKKIDEYNLALQAMTANSMAESYYMEKAEEVLARVYEEETQQSQNQELQSMVTDGIHMTEALEYGFKMTQDMAETCLEELKNMLKA